MQKKSNKNDYGNVFFEERRQYMKKLKDNEISLLMDFTGVPAGILLQVLFTFFSNGNISTETVAFCLWFPTMWQMAACFFAIRYIRKNPNDWRVKFIWKKEEIAAIAV